MEKYLKYKEIVKRLTVGNFDTLKEEYHLNHNEMLGILDYGLHDKNIFAEKREILNNLKYAYQFSLILSDLKIGCISDTHIGNEKDNPYYINECYHFLEKEGINKVLHTGDILDAYDERVALTKSEVINMCYKQITRFHDFWPTNIITIAILGNHDVKLEKIGLDLYNELASDTFIVLGLGGAYIKCANYKLFLEHKVPSSILVPSYYNYDVILSGHSHLFKYKKNINMFKVGSCSDLQPNAFSLASYDPGFITITTSNFLEIDIYNIINNEIGHTLSLKLK